MRTVTLARILEGLDSVDLIDLDIEGAELTVLASAIEELDRRVKRLHIGTHTREIEHGLRTLFREHGWYKRNDYEVGSTELTPWGPIAFNNGVQTWINPRLVTVQPTEAELRWVQWAMRSTEVRYGRRCEELRTAVQAMENARRRIVAMESSKFWKLRRVWFRLKRSVGLGKNE